MNLKDEVNATRLCHVLKNSARLFIRDDRLNGEIDEARPVCPLQNVIGDDRKPEETPSSPPIDSAPKK